MTFALFLIVTIPLYAAWCLYHLFIKNDFEKIKGDAITGGLFLAVSAILFYVLFIR